MILVESSPVVVISLAIIAAVVSIVTAFFSYLSQKNARLAFENTKNVVEKINEVKTVVDGKMTELLEATKKADNLEGAERERVEARARDDAKKD